MKQRSAGSVLAAMLLAGCVGPTVDDTSYRPKVVKAFEVGRVGEAQSHCERALSRAPSDPFALYYMGRISSARADWETAIYYYQCCLDADPRYTDARRQLFAAEQAAGVAGPMLRFIPVPPARPRTFTSEPHAVGTGPAVIGMRERTEEEETP